MCNMLQNEYLFAPIGADLAESGPNVANKFDEVWHLDDPRASPPAKVRAGNRGDRGSRPALAQVRRTLLGRLCTLRGPGSKFRQKKKKTSTVLVSSSDSLEKKPLLAVSPPSLLFEKIE